MDKQGCLSKVACRSFAVLLCTVPCAALVGARDRPDLQPVWSTDLQQADFFPSPGFQFSLHAHPRRIQSLFTRDSVVFAPGGHIAIAYLNKHLGGKFVSSSRGPGSLELHLVSLDAASGRIIAHRAWPAPEATLDNVYVGANRDGNFLLLQRNSLCLYSPELREIKKLGLPADPEGRSFWTSPDGESVFLRHYSGNSSSMEMLSATTLQPVRFWDKAEFLSSGGTSGYLMKVGENKNLYVRTFEGPWLMIADLSQCRGGWMARFVTDDSVLVSDCDPVRLIRADGKTLFTAHAPKGRLFRNAWGSIDGKYVAAATTTMGGTRIALAFDMSAGAAPRGILVYDVKSGTVVSRIRSTWGTTCAFSADRPALAVFSRGLVELFRLPESRK